MTIMRWKPIQELEMLQRDFDRLADVLIPNTMVLTAKPKVNFVPPAEMTRTEEAIDLRLEIPGLENEDFEIEATEESITIKGERKEENKTEKEGTTKSEFHYGKFNRTISLPVLVDNASITAQYRNGILQIVLPLVQAQKQKVVKVAVE